MSRRQGRNVKLLERTVDGEGLPLSFGPVPFQRTISAQRASTAVSPSTASAAAAAAQADATTALNALARVASINVTTTPTTLTAGQLVRGITIIRGNVGSKLDLDIPASLATDRILFIRDEAGNDIDVTCNGGSGNVDGATSALSVGVSGSVILYSDGAGWWSV